MAIAQIASELSDDHRLSRSKFHQPWISTAHFECETFGSVAGPWRRRAISAQCHPIAVALARKIILESVPFPFGFVVPVHVPYPGEIVGAFCAQTVDNVLIG